VTDDAQAVGSLRSRQGVMLRPEVSGRIAQLGFADGQAVRRGQVLVQLDDTLQQAQLQQAQAQASIARTNLQRSRELLAQQFISQSAVDQNAAALQVADAQVALAQAQLARMRINAPFDGRAGIRSVNVGDYVKDGADLVNIEDSRSMLVDLRLPERYSARLKPGQPVQLDVDALPGKPFAARIDALDSLVDANGRSLLVRARVDNPGGELRPGMFARARVVFAVRENAVVVPEEALVPMGGKQWLVKVVDGPEGKPVSQRLEAKLGLRLPGQAEVLAGVAEGDKVVTAGHGRLMRDQPVPVRVIDLAQAGRGGPPGGGPAAGGPGRPPGAGPGAGPGAPASAGPGASAPGGGASGPAASRAAAGA
jgi:membrane fusion protein, multidrug efflux system